MEKLFLKESNFEERRYKKSIHQILYSLTTCYHHLCYLFLNVMIQSHHPVTEHLIQEKLLKDSIWAAPLFGFI